jgi:dienelactone hydrolase
MSQTQRAAQVLWTVGVLLSATACSEIEEPRYLAEEQGPLADEEGGGFLGGLFGGGGSGGGAGAIIRGGDPTDLTVNNAGPYRVSSYGIFDKGAVRDGDGFGGFDIYYPANATPPFAIVAIVPGFVSDRSWVGDWAPFLASHGIAAFLTEPNWLTDDPNARKDALLDALVSMKGENTRSGSPLQGKLEVNRTAVLGWSMGGGGALLAAAEDPSLKAAIGICPWNLFALSYIGVRVPSLMFGGTSDILAGGMPNEFYHAMPSSTPKLLFDLDGGDHWYANSPSGHWNAVGRFGLSFLKVFLEGDERYRKFLKVAPLGLNEFAHNL